MRFLWIVLVQLSTAVGSAHAQQQPNIVLVFMDNFGYGELGVYGGGITRGGATPRIDTLASEGLRLTNFNVEVQCTPSRSALMTGRYAIRSGTATVPITTGLYGLTQWEVTIAESLSEAGYVTGMFGKWHLGHTEGRYPTDQGFDEWYGIPNSTDESLWPDQAQFNSVVKENLSPFAVPAYVYSGRRDQEPQKVKVYDSKVRPEIDGEITDRAIDFMQRQAKGKKPFFAYIPTNAPHDPLHDIPQASYEKYRTRDFSPVLGSQTRFADRVARIFAMIDNIDQNLDRISMRYSCGRPVALLTIRQHPNSTRTAHAYSCFEKILVAAKQSLVGRLLFGHLYCSDLGPGDLGLASGRFPTDSGRDLRLRILHEPRGDVEIP